MFFCRNFSRRHAWALMLIASTTVMVACDEETTVTDATDSSPEEVAIAAETVPNPEATAGTDLPSDSPAPQPEQKAVSPSRNVKDAAADEDMPDWVKWQSPILDGPTLHKDINTLVDYSRYPKVDNTNLSEFEMMRYEAIGSALGEARNLEFLMGYCYQSYCQETYYIFPSQVATDGTESEWSVEVISLGQFQDQPATWDVKPAATQVLCSTTRPMVVDFDGEEYIINHISAGSPMSYAFAGLQEPDALYWKICHGADSLFPSEVAEFAKGFGYDLGTKPRTVQQDFIELLEP